MTEPTSPGPSGLHYVLLIGAVIGLALVTVVVLGLAGFVHPPAWELLTCIINHCRGVATSSCI